MKNKGQSTIEYVLLLAVIVSISLSIINSDRFKELIGKDAQVFKNIRDQFNFSYRHGLAGSSEDDPSSYSGTHETYFNREEGRSR